MKTRDAFAFRDFDIETFLSTAMKESGLDGITLGKLLEAVQIFDMAISEKILATVQMGEVNFAALGVDNTNISKLQSAREKYFRLKLILEELRLRLVRHHKRIERCHSFFFKDKSKLNDDKFYFDVYKPLTKRILDLSEQYTEISKRNYSVIRLINAIIDGIDTAQRHYFKDTFAKRLRQARKEIGLTQGDVSELLRLNTTALGTYERGRSEPNISQLGVLSQILRKTPNWLLGLE